MAMYTSDTVYDGEETIVISLDIGTTHSAVTFSHVYPGDKPDVRSVLRWPGQEDATGDSKIPTIIAYQNGEPKFCGAETFEYLDDEEYEIARWFKLHLHPESMRIPDQPPAYPGDNPAAFEIPKLPEQVSLEQVYVDFIKYIYNAARNYFVKGTPNGSNIWDRLRDHIIVVMCTPNGWDISQHMFLRKAAIKAGLVSENDADGRLEFITEGEASVHYALAHTKGKNWLKSGAMFMVTDAGGSTVDSTLYECKSTNPLVLEEVCASECVQAGGIFVDRAARTLLKDKLGSSRYGGDEWVSAIVRAFEKRTKRMFDGSQASNVLTFGGPGDNDRGVGILKGKLSLNANEVSSTFESVVARTVESCHKLLKGRKVKHMLLVGGFGESPYLREKLHHIFNDQGTEVVIVEEPSKKAAALVNAAEILTQPTHIEPFIREGATIWFIKQLVKARAARCTYGVEGAVVFDRRIHSSRISEAFMADDGKERVWSFVSIVDKDFVLPKDWEKDSAHSQLFNHRPTDLSETRVEIYAWEKTTKADRVHVRGTTGELVPGMRHLCSLRADMGHLKQAVTLSINAQTQTRYYQIDYEVVMSFKRAKLQAKLRWIENGQTREGPVTILPESTF